MRDGRGRLPPRLLGHRCGRRRRHIGSGARHARGTHDDVGTTGASPCGPGAANTGVDSIAVTQRGCASAAMAKAILVLGRVSLRSFRGLKIRLRLRLSSYRLAIIRLLLRHVTLSSGGWFPGRQCSSRWLTVTSIVWGWQQGTCLLPWALSRRPIWREDSLLGHETVFFFGGGENDAEEVPPFPQPSVLRKPASHNHRGLPNMTTPLLQIWLIPILPPLNSFWETLGSKK